MKNTDPKTNIIFATPLYFKDVENPLLNNELLKYCLSLKKKRKGRKRKKREEKQEEGRKGKKKRKG